MALQKQKVQLNISNGIDTKSDSPSVLATSFTEAENVSFSKLGGAQKRLGTSAVSNQIVSGGTISSGTSLASYNDQLIMTDNSSLYAYSPATSKWNTKGDFKPFVSNYTTKYDKGNGINSVRHAVSGNLVGYAISEESIEEQYTESKLIVEDINTGTVLFSQTFTTSTGSSNIAGNAKGFIFTTDREAYLFDPTTLSLSTAIAFNASNNMMYVTSNNNYFYIFYYEGVSSTYKLRLFDPDNVVVSTATITTAYAPQVATLSFEGNGANIRLTYGVRTGTSQTVRTLLRSASNLTTVIHAEISVGSSTLISNITGIQTISSSTTCQIIHSFASVSGSLQEYKVSSAGTVLSSSAIYGQTQLVSNACLYNSKHYVAVKQQLAYSNIPTPPANRTSGSEKQTFGTTTYILESSDNTTWKIVAYCDVENTKYYKTTVKYRTNPEEERLIQNPSTLISINGELSLVNLAITSFPFQTATVTRDWTTCKVTQLNIIPSTNVDISTVRTKNQLIYNGALPLLFDGTNVAEQGFIDRPQITNITQATTAGPDDKFAVGTYRFYVLLSYRDSNGNVYRSAPSDNQYVQVTVANCYQLILTMSQVNFTLKPNVTYEVYMTNTNGTTYHLLDSKLVSISSTTITINGYGVAENVTSGEVLYTTGGGLEYDSLPPSYHLAVHKNRVFSINDDRQSLSYSQLIEQNSPIFFNLNLKITVPEIGGKLTGIASLDNSLIIFKENFIFAMNGDGPNNLGQQDDFTVPQLITADTGCINKNSIVSTPEGILFNSAKGIYLLGRNFSVQYKGAPAEGFNSNIIVATMLPTTNEIRFLMEDSSVVVYDYFSNRWSTQPRWDERDLSASPVVDMIVTEDSNLYHLESNGRVVVYNTDKSLQVSFTDCLNGTNGIQYIPIKLTSAWISFAGLQGYQRLYKLMILATYKSPHKLKVSFAYDMSETYVDSVTIDSTTVTDTDFYNLEIRPKRQKCSMVKFKIEELPPDTFNYGEGLTISGLAMELGVKEGLNKTVNTHGAT